MVKLMCATHKLKVTRNTSLDGVLFPPLALKDSRTKFFHPCLDESLVHMGLSGMGFISRFRQTNNAIKTDVFTYAMRWYGRWVSNSDILSADDDHIANRKIGVCDWIHLAIYSLYLIRCCPASPFLNSTCVPCSIWCWY